ncbi:MAG: hypothetical protein IJ083_07925 [Clostridia bacterium]|nr:hypothetical protein [Clostridia bacterium]
MQSSAKNKTNPSAKKPGAKKVVHPVTKPYLTGSAVDGTTVKSALMIFGGIAACAVLFLIVCSVMLFDSLALRIVTNGLVMAVVLLIFYSSGISRGSVAVNQGEIMYHRRETGMTIKDEEQARCYHPLKGFIIGLLGTLPFFLAALVLGLIAKRQMTGLGALPSWVSGAETREEIALPLKYYHQGMALGLEGTLRLVVRLSIMPFVNMVGTASPDNLLTLERCSCLLELLPGIAYGFGYTRGVDVRTKVHTDIAAGKRKRARKAKKEKERRRAPKGPTQLN